mmetsp:Transcript_8388/g.25209  ORF Transcript_8388/g.25209 Transcript_8388/m.25209 type:complete len:439 (-) Transcript_8388:47-1363(-)|eukprot:CAMPEP_0198732946 /NCGR_PEP_ID=MMETSP1475-20131203/41321_1 /TAXON_ID= ORGANISM="Unidentified sp., Strain CCMP1999" /NCGR_SAMPLE_ID=MMETSP1475 /ASSEMBLY_ACC=CAM_ASM_001111 /LENGTH=438 /DNA_ID=CAMNT_0044496159 /DNA_START=97 /DNA_END=1413 /DNA_ORIENTATION=+
MMRLVTFLAVLAAVSWVVVAQKCPKVKIGRPTILKPKVSKSKEYVFFGQNMRIYGDRIVGCGYGLNGWSGGCWSYIFDGSEWKFEQEILPPVKGKEQFFGLNLALWDKILVVGHPFATPYGSRSGQAEMFEFEGGKWVNTVTLRAPREQGDGEADAYFGYAVGLERKTLVVGARNQKNPDTGLVKAGAVYVYNRLSRTDWSLETTFRGVQGGTQYGDEVDVSGTSGSNPVVMVGSPRHRRGKFPIGGMYLYHKVDSSWTLLQETTIKEDPSFPVNNQYNSHYGEGIDIQGDECMLGGERGPSPLSKNSGSVHLFKRQGTGKYVQYGSLFPNRGGVNFFGQRVAFNKNVYITGAWGSSESGNRSGSGYVFAKCSDNSFTLVNKLFRVDAEGNKIGASNDEFGKVARMTDSWIAFGGPKVELGDSTNVGIIQIYPYTQSA